MAVMALLPQWLLAVVHRRRGEYPLEASPLEAHLAVLMLAASVAAGAVCIWLFAPRIIGRAYRGFRLVACSAPGENLKLTAPQRTRLWFFVWWRLTAGGLFALLLAMPLNMLLSTMGIHAASPIAGAAGLFLIGPLVMKMLVGHPLKDFRIEVRRPFPSPPDATKAGADAVNTAC